MKILIATANCITPELQTELEIIERHLDEGDTLYYIVCDRELQNCFLYDSPTNHDCLVCKTRINIGISLLSKEINIINLDIEPSRYTKTNIKFDNITKLKAFSHNGNPVGIIVASTLIHKLKNENFDTIHHTKIINDHINTYINLYNAALRILTKIKPDKVYIFNGRFTTSHPIIMACLKKNIDFFTYERSGTLNKYRVTYKSLPHTIHTIANECECLYQKYDKSEAEFFAKEYYTSLRNKKNLNGFCFTANQKNNKLPDNFDRDKKNIVFFNSSIFECASLPDECGYYQIICNSDSELVTKLSETLSSNKEIHIYCRIHPNIANTNSSQLVDLLKLNHLQNVTIIPPESDIDTYALMENASIVLTSHSTTGAEAAYWGKPVILVSNSPYRSLGGFYTPQSYQELINLLLADLKPISQIGAIKYGLWLSKSGIGFRYYTPIDSGNGLFRGVNIKERAHVRLFIPRLLRFIKRFFSLLVPSCKTEHWR